MPIYAEAALWDATRAAVADGDLPAGSPMVARPGPWPGRGRTLEEVLVARRSVRSFGTDPVDPGRLQQILDYARAADARTWTGLAVPGSTPVVVLPAPGSPLHGVVAAHYVDAPVVVLVLADVAAATARAGGPGYRQCLLRTAGFGYAAWLAAVAAGLGGSVYGRSLPQVTATLRARHRTTRRHLFTVAIGTPA